MREAIDCPSAQAGTRGARVYGVMTGPAGDQRVGYLTETLRPNPDLLALAGDAKPTQLFRIAAPCAQGACAHFDGSCTLARRIVAGLEPVVDGLPACQIRATCRWHLQEGDAACTRCPQVATDKVDATETERRIAAVA
ncbi:hypothetical protein [Methylobacterium sp. JK268]